MQTSQQFPLESNPPTQQPATHPQSLPLPLNTQEIIGQPPSSEIPQSDLNRIDSVQVTTDKHLEFLKMPAKTQFVVGEKIWREDLLVKLVESDGSFVLIRDFELHPDNVLTQSDNEVVIHYGDLELTYPITVVNKMVLAVVINSMPKKLEYICGTKELDLSGGTLAVFFSDSTNAQIEMTPDMIEGFDGDKIGRQIVNICYRNQKLPIQITVRKKNIVKVEVISQPNKRDYTEGERLDTSGLVLCVTYDNDEKEYITDYECPEIKVKKEQAVVQMDYKGHIFPVFVHVSNCVLTGIRMEALPEKRTYLEKRDMLEVTGGRVARIMSNGEVDIVPLEMRMVSGFNNQRVGTCRIAVTLDDFQCFYEVEIVGREVAKLEVVQKPHKITYFEQESFEPEGMEIKAQYNNNTFERVEGFEYAPHIVDCSTSAVTVSFGGKTVDVPIQVQMRMVESISIAKMPDKMHFKEGRESLDVSGGKLLVIYNNGSADTIDMYEDMIEGFDNMKAGDNLLTVRLQDKETQYHVVIDPKVLIGISITKMPDKTVYQKGDIVDLSGMKLLGFYDNSTMVEIQNYAHQPSDALQMEDTAIIVSYMDKMAIVPITVVEELPEEELRIIEEKSKDMGEEQDAAAQIVSTTANDDEAKSEQEPSWLKNVLGESAQESGIAETVDENSHVDGNDYVPAQKDVMNKVIEPALEKVRTARLYAGTGNLRYKKDKNNNIFA